LNGYFGLAERLKWLECALKCKIKANLPTHRTAQKKCIFMGMQMRRKTEAELKALVEPVAEKYYFERYTKPFLEAHHILLNSTYEDIVRLKS